MTYNAGRHSADFFSRQAVHLGDFANGRSEAETVLIRHHGGLTLAILLEHPFQNVVTLIPCKIDIDVRWIFSAGIEKPFEEEGMLDRINMSED